MDTVAAELSKASLLHRQPVVHVHTFDATPPAQCTEYPASWLLLWAANLTQYGAVDFVCVVKLKD